MDLFEYQGKQLFARYGIPVSDGAPVTTVPEAVEVADRIGYPVVVKAQVQVGGRGKAGGIKLAANSEEARTHAENILGMDIKGHEVKVVWIETASDIAEEYYASFTLDRAAKLHLGMLSAQGGVEIEQVAEENPDAIAKIHVDPVDGLTEAQCREWVAAAKLNPAATEGAVDILMKLYQAYVDGDADLVEINPLILTPDGRVHALDAKVTLDDNAIFRHPDYTDYDATQVRDARESFAHEQGLQYVGLDGSVGVIANGAGLAMSTVDIVNQVGGSPANFLDIGGGANADVMAGALERHRERRQRALDLHQHLRRHHQGRRGRQRHRAGARARADRRPDRDPPRRHQRRRGSQDPRTPPVRQAADAAHHDRRGEEGRRACRRQVT